MNTVHLADCLPAMREMEDNAYDLAVVDPPYGIGTGENSGTANLGGSNMALSPTYKVFNDRTPPPKTYFNELRRVSINQVIWGGNYFIDSLNSTPCFLVWDKDKRCKFSDCELAWTSFDTAVRKFRYRWNGMLQEKMANKPKANKGMMAKTKVAANARY